MPRELPLRVGPRSAPVPVAVAERAVALGIGVMRAYGSTERPSATGSLPDAPRAKRNCTDGRPLSGVELRLVDERGHDVAPGHPGEIWSRGVVEDFPRTPSGRIKKSVLRDDLRAEHARRRGG